jgi:hypothetical protein
VVFRGGSAVVLISAAVEVGRRGPAQVGSGALLPQPSIYIPPRDTTPTAGRLDSAGAGPRSRCCYSPWLAARTAPLLKTDANRPAKARSPKEVPTPPSALPKALPGPTLAPGGGRSWAAVSCEVAPGLPLLLGPSCRSSFPA